MTYYTQVSKQFCCRRRGLSPREKGVEDNACTVTRGRVPPFLEIFYHKESEGYITLKKQKGDNILKRMMMLLIDWLVGWVTGAQGDWLLLVGHLSKFKHSNQWYNDKIKKLNVNSGM